MSDTQTETPIEVRLNKNIPLPKKNYVLRCTEEEVKASSKGNMMIVIELEIVDPAQVPFGENKVLVLGGTTMTKYLVFKVLNEDGSTNEKNTGIAIDKLKEFYTLLGLSKDFDKENPVATNQIKGMLIDWICYAKEYTICEDLTPEQKAKGDKQGSPILDRNTNKPLRGFKPELGDMQGVSSFKPTNPY